MNVIDKKIEETKKMNDAKKEELNKKIIELQTELKTFEIDNKTKSLKLKEEEKVTYDYYFFNFYQESKILSFKAGLNRKIL